MSLYEGAVKKPIMTSLCFLAVAIFGLFSLSKLPVDLYPDIDTNTIEPSYVQAFRKYISYHFGIRVWL